jgi:thioredoxin
MNYKKAFPFAVAALVIVILAIILMVLYQDGILKTGTRNTTAGNAVVQLVVNQGSVKQEPIADFNAFIAAADKPVFVDFWAEWCPPCRLAAPFVEQLAIEYEGKAIIVKIDVDQAMALASQYKAQSIPQFSVFSGGKLVESTAGYADSMQNSLRQMIDRLLP